MDVQKFLSEKKVLIFGAMGLLMVLLLVFFIVNNSIKKKKVEEQEEAIKDAAEEGAQKAILKYLRPRA